jgi:hypothetical protein
MKQHGQALDKHLHDWIKGQAALRRKYTGAQE